MISEQSPLMVENTALLLGFGKSTVYANSMWEVLPCYRPSGGLLHLKMEDLRAEINSETASGQGADHRSSEMSVRTHFHNYWRLQGQLRAVNFYQLGALTVPFDVRQASLFIVPNEFDTDIDKVVGEAAMS